MLLAIVLIPGIGHEAGGSRRWLDIPIVGGFQPAEVAKLAIVLYLAHWLDRRGSAARGLRGGLIPFALLVAPGFVLIALEPDLGTAGIYIVAAFSVFFMSGASVTGIIAVVGAIAAAGVFVVSRNPYQLERITSFLDPEKDPLGTGYNAMQALMALAMGGIPDCRDQNANRLAPEKARADKDQAKNGHDRMLRASLWGFTCILL